MLNSLKIEKLTCVADGFLPPAWCLELQWKSHAPRAVARCANFDSRGMTMHDSVDVEVWEQWRAEGGTNGATTPGIQGGGLPKSEITQMKML